jgi:hypothetical protein
MHRVSTVDTSRFPLLRVSRPVLRDRRVNGKARILDTLSEMSRVSRLNFICQVPNVNKHQTQTLNIFGCQELRQTSLSHLDSLVYSNGD